MKFRTNRQRAERKLDKAMALKAAIAAEPKQIHTTYHSKAGYSEIITSIRAKTSLITILNAHTREGIAKIMLYPRLLWSRGTYRLKEHGKLKFDKSK